MNNTLREYISQFVNGIPFLTVAFFSSKSSGEMALLVEGLGGGGEASIEEYIIGPANELSDSDQAPDKDQIRLYGTEGGVSWIAKPVTGQSTLGIVSRCGSMANQTNSLMDPTVTLFGSIHENFGDNGGRRSMLFPNFGSMFNVGNNTNLNEEVDVDVESSQRERSDGSGAESDDNIRSPLLSRQDTDVENPSPNAVEQVSGMDIGGGWQLAYRVSEGKGEDGNRNGGGGLKRIYLHQESTTASRRGSILSFVSGDVQVESEGVHASALVSQSALPSKDLISQFLGEIEKVKPSAVAKGPGLADLFDPGVKHALVVGVGIQILQQVIIYVI